MTSLCTIQIRNDHKAIIADLDTGEATGVIRLETPKGWSGNIDVMVKFPGERKVKVVSLQDDFNVYDLPWFLEGYIETDMVSRWRYAVEEHAA